MPEEERRISPAVVIPVGLVLAGLLGIFAVACAAPPEAYTTCPVCSDEFGTLEELQYHFTTSHPREPIPIEWQ